MNESSWLSRLLWNLAPVNLSFGPLMMCFGLKSFAETETAMAGAVMLMFGLIILKKKIDWLSERGPSVPSAVMNHPGKQTPT